MKRLNTHIDSGMKKEVVMPSISEERLTFYTLLVALLGGRHETCCINPLSPNSDQHQISPYNINAYTAPEVMRIKDMITQGEFS